MERDESFKKIMPLVIQLLNKGGWDIIKDALNTQDPAQGIGTFLSELIMKVAIAAEQKGLKLDMRVFMRRDGIVEEILNIVEQHFDMPPEFSDEIFMRIIDIIEQGLAQQEQGGQPPQAPMQGQPGLEQQAPQQPMMGGM